MAGPPRVRHAGSHGKAYPSYRGVAVNGVLLKQLPRASVDRVGQSVIPVVPVHDEALSWDSRSLHGCDRGRDGGRRKDWVSIAGDDEQRQLPSRHLNRREVGRASEGARMDGNGREVLGLEKPEPQREDSTRGVSKQVDPRGVNRQLPE